MLLFTTRLICTSFYIHIVLRFYSIAHELGYKWLFIKYSAGINTQACVGRIRSSLNVTYTVVRMHSRFVITERLVQER